MCRRFLRMLLLVVGCVLVFAGGFPVLAFVHLGDPLQTMMVASKLLMLPLGAMCLIWAAGLNLKHR